MNELPLRDIHMPDAISWWPLAPGWWFLIVMFLLSPLMSWWLWRVWQAFQHAPLRLAKKQLSRLKHEFQEHQDRQRLLQEISVLLKQTVIAQHPQQHRVAGLQGQDWLAFLDDSMQGQDFTKGAGRCLLYGPYQKDALEYDCDALIVLVQAWLKQQGKQ